MDECKHEWVETNIGVSCSKCLGVRSIGWLIAALGDTEEELERVRALNRDYVGRWCAAEAERDEERQGRHRAEASLMDVRNQWLDEKGRASAARALLQESLDWIECAEFSDLDEEDQEMVVDLRARIEAHLEGQ